MRKVILLMGISVDGYDAGGWIPETDIARRQVQDELWSQLHSVDTFLMGRVTHQVWFDYWPGERNSNSPFFARFSRFADDVKKIVVSNTMTASQWNNSRVIGRDLRANIAELKEQPGNDIAIVGGADVARAIGKLELIDEYRLWVHPEIRGAGSALLATGQTPLSVTLAGVKTFGSGLLALHYRNAALTSSRG